MGRLLLRAFVTILYKNGGFFEKKSVQLHKSLCLAKKSVDRREGM